MKKEIYPSAYPEEAYNPEFFKKFAQTSRTCP